MTAAGPSNMSSLLQSTVEIVLKIHETQEEGHILVFLTGQEDIEKACSMLRDALESRQDSQVTASSYPILYNSFLLIEKLIFSRQVAQDRHLIVLPLYAALTNEQQLQIFQKPQILYDKLVLRKPFSTSRGADNNAQTYPHLIRKCVIATNIAETSITVPHIRYVIDSGYVKQKVYDASRGMESLVVVPVSKVAALQRAGRAGTPTNHSILSKNSLTPLTALNFII